MKNGQAKTPEAEAERVAKISAAQVKRHTKRIVAEKAQPRKKRCSICKQVKRVPYDFIMQKRTLASGIVREYPSGQCIECNKERVNAYRAKNHEKILAKERVRSKERKAADPIKHRSYQRDWARMKYAELHPDVVPYGPRPKSQAEDRVLERRQRVDAAEFLEWYEDRKPEGLDENQERTIRRLQSGEQATITAAMADEIAALVGDTHLLAVVEVLDNKTQSALK